MYSTNIQLKSEEEFYHCYTMSLKGEGLISDKLPMTEDKRSTFVKYTVGAMVHMVYVRIRTMMEH